MGEEKTAFLAHRRCLCYPVCREGIGLIRLIATDLDGTLLNDQKQLPPDFFSILQALNERNIRFVAASGRSRQALSYVFGKALEHMTLICDNGAFWVEEGKNTFRSDLRPEDVAQMTLALDGEEPQ